MSLNLILFSKQGMFPLLKTPTEVTKRVLEVSTILGKAEEYLLWCEPNNIHDDTYKGIQHASAYHKHSSDLYKWLCENPDCKWGIA